MVSINSDRDAGSSEPLVQPSLTRTDTNISLTVYQSPLLKAFERATKTFTLCPNRVWAVAEEKLPDLLPDNKLPSHQGHNRCNINFCEHSQRDFTKIEQHHECYDEKCGLLTGLFSKHKLKEAAENRRSTVWSLDGMSMIDFPRPHMAISHVWSDGTGAGSWRDGEVNKCLYRFFRDIARRFQCEGIWWDTVCIPSEKAARNIAIQNIQSNYENARITLVHDCFLRNWTWIDAETACFAILMSPWFSRGWTALELVKSRKVKVMFGGPHGPVIKDLDEEILAKDTDCKASKSHLFATGLIRALRDGVTTLNDLLTVLDSRHTSWPKDLAIISALLVDVSIASNDLNEDTWQQDIYQRILLKFGAISPGHLFHNSPTMSHGFNWCPSSLYYMSRDSSPPSLAITLEGDLIGQWIVIATNSSLREIFSWNSTHPLIKEQILSALKYPDKCLLLMDPLGNHQDKALLVTVVEQEPRAEQLCLQYVGAVYFHPAMFKHNMTNESRTTTAAVRIRGRVYDALESTQTAWELVESFLYGSQSQLPYQKNKCQPTEKTSVGQPGNMGVSLISAVKRGATDDVMKYLQDGGDPNYQDDCGWAAIHHAAFRDDSEILELLIRVPGLDINAQDKRGQQALHIAAERGCSNIGFLQGYKSKIHLTSDKNGQNALHRAAWAGSLPTMDILLDLRFDLHEQDRSGDMVLHIIAQQGHDAMMKRICERSELEVNLGGYKMLTPLHYAAENGHYDMTQLLLSKNADVSARDEVFGWTPLHLAAMSGHDAVARLLIDHGADIHATDSKIGWRPLHFAAMNGHHLIVQMLIDEGVDTHVKDKKGWTAYEFASMKNLLKVVALLSNDDADAVSANIDWAHWTNLHCLMVESPQDIHHLLSLPLTGMEKDDGWKAMLFIATNGLESVLELALKKGYRFMGENALTVAAINGQAKIAKLLMCNDTNPDSIIYRTTPLCSAAENGRTDVVEILLKEGAKWNVNTPEGLSPLLFAIRNRDKATLSLLLEYGADINGTELRESPLVTIILRDWGIQTVEFLLDMGADAGKLPNFYLGEMPIEIAIRKGDAQLLDYLMSHGASLETRDHEGHTPLHRAVRSGDEAMVKTLLNKSSNIRTRTNSHETILHTAAREDHAGIIQLLLDHGVSVNDMDRFKQTPLHVATKNGHVRATRLLIDYGAPVDALDWVKKTPLHVAICGIHTRIEVVQLLLNNKAATDLQDDKLCTPLHYAATKDCTYYRAIEDPRKLARILLDRGFSVNIKNDEGCTPLHSAATFGNKDLMQLLVAYGAKPDLKDNKHQTPQDLLARWTRNHKRVGPLNLGPNFLASRQS